MNICGNCLVQFKPSQGSAGKYCSRSCAVTVANRNNPKRKRKVGPPRPCKRCGVDLAGKTQKVYCSNQCMTSHRAEQGVQGWLAGTFDGTTPRGFMANGVRDYLLEQAGGKCPQCGWGEPNPHSGRVTLTIDHKDGDSSNNKPGNLEVLCYNCHTLTPTFNELNRGRGTRYETPGSRERKSNRGDSAGEEVTTTR